MKAKEKKRRYLEKFNKNKLKKYLLNILGKK